MHQVRHLPKSGPSAWTHGILHSLLKQLGAEGLLAACVTAYVCRRCSGWAFALEPPKVRYRVTPTFATLRRNGRSRRFDPIFTLLNGPPRLRDLPSHPRLLEASQMPARCLIDAVWVLALGSYCLFFENRFWDTFWYTWPFRGT